MIPPSVIRKLDRIQEMVEQETYKAEPRTLQLAIESINSYFPLLDDADQSYIEQAYWLASKYQ